MADDEAAEANRTDCFLCNPNGALVFHEGSAGIALAGLGPIVDGYTVVASRQHVSSATDLPGLALKSFCTYAEQIRGKLVEIYGSCLMTEHGKAGLCGMGDDAQ